MLNPMSRRFQFSLKRILGTTVLAALGVWLWSLRDEAGDIFRPFLGLAAVAWFLLGGWHLLMAYVEE
jgi:hypothetical protein